MLPSRWKGLIVGVLVTSIVGYMIGAALNKREEQR